MSVPKKESATRVHWLLLGSLALNLGFMGAAGAVAFHYTSPTPLTDVARSHRSGARGLDHLAANLPPDDARIIREQLEIDAGKISAARADLRLSEEAIRVSLRAQPFEATAMHDAMEKNRVARENFETVLHDVIATAAAKMSVVGRDKLADWPESRRAPVNRD
jgi:uncharacterized membrane protein